MKAVSWQRQAQDAALTAPYTGDEAALVTRFHEGMPGYRPTPLLPLPNLAAFMGVNSIHVKDESRRFSLNAFKALGGSWAVARHVAQALDIPLTEMSWARLTAPNTLSRVKGLKLVTATDGNHGRGIAWMGKQLGLETLVFMPEGSSEERLGHIRALGARADILPMNYDDTRRHAQRVADRTGGLLIQDTAWEGYREIPGWIMQGYVTIASEIEAQLKGDGLPPPTHVFLQCGAGSFAAAMAVRINRGDVANRPFTAIVEPDGANCFYLTAKAGDGRLRAVTGHLDSIMAGLCVGEPSTLGWELLKGCADAFVSCPDETARLGMRMLGAPLEGDPRIISGESGAVGLGLLAAACLPGGEKLKEKLRLDDGSRVLLISTEGDTDTASYRDILWGLRRD